MKTTKLFLSLLVYLHLVNESISIISNKKRPPNVKQNKSKNNDNYGWKSEPETNKIMSFPKNNEWEIPMQFNKEVNRMEEQPMYYYYIYNPQEESTDATPSGKRKRKNCDGYENFKKDLEILGLNLGWIAFKVATLGFFLHIVNQIYLFFSVYMIGIPEKTFDLINLLRVGVIPAQLERFFEILALLDYIVNSVLSYPLGNLVVVIDFIAEVLTLISLLMATVTVYDEFIVKKLKIAGVDLKDKFEKYRCP